MIRLLVRIQYFRYVGPPLAFNSVRYNVLELKHAVNV